MISAGTWVFLVWAKMLFDVAERGNLESRYSLLNMLVVRLISLIFYVEKFWKRLTEYGAWSTCFHRTLLVALGNLRLKVQPLIQCICGTRPDSGNRRMWHTPRTSHHVTNQTNKP